MIHTKSSIVINRPLDTVWDFLMDLDSYSLWQPGSGKISATNHLNIGSVLEANFHYAGKDHLTVAEVTNNDGQSTYQVRSKQGPITYFVTYLLTPESDSATRLTIDSEADAGTFLKLAEPVIKYVSETRQEANVKVLKSILESGVSEIAR